MENGVKRYTMKTCRMAYGKGGAVFSSPNSTFQKEVSLMKATPQPVTYQGDRISSAGSAALARRPGRSMGRRILDNLGSEWVGWYWFQRFFSSPTCWRMIKNTVLISLYSLLWSFPIPIILSLIINQLRFHKFKRVVQTVLYAPHFISVMVICGMIRIFLSPSGGLLNLLLGTQIDFLTQSSAFRTIYIASGIWQDAGWGCIIYLATLANVDPGLYEAAKIDGASVFQRILNIDIPELLPMAILNLIMAAGGLMNVGFEKVWLLQTDLNRATSDVIAVYVYQQGIESAKYSYSTAVGLFNTAVNIVLLLVVNKIASKASDVEFV